MIVPLKDLSAALATIHDMDPGPYDVSFHLSEAGEAVDLHLVRREDGPSTPEARAFKAELALRRIATVFLQARVSRNYEMAVELGTEAHNAWVSDKGVVTARVRPKGT